MANNKIRISCECKDFLDLNVLEEFQGNLKSRSAAQIDKIVKSIKKFGFSFPFFVWNHDGINHVLDGHGRLSALHKLDELGYEIPALPIVYVKCNDERDARDLLLRLNSQYGTMTKDSVLEFIGDFDIEVSNFELSAGIIDFQEESLDVSEPKEEIGLELKEKYEVIVSCKDAAEQEEVFYKLTDEGYNVKVSTM